MKQTQPFEGSEGRNRAGVCRKGNFCRRNAAVICLSDQNPHPVPVQKFGTNGYLSSTSLQSGDSLMYCTPTNVPLLEIPI